MKRNKRINKGRERETSTLWKKQRKLMFSCSIIVAMLLFLIQNVSSLGYPTGPNAITNITQWNGSNNSGVAFNATPGTINVLVINITQQNPHWKAYVGNISGALALEDPYNNSIYSWDLITPTGELYATRVNETITWENIRCANATDIFSEQGNLSINNTQVDSINRTFNDTLHQSFYVGDVLVSQNNCYSTALFINNTRQTSYFQEILLSDGQGIIYTTILENARYGFNYEKYDFQMIIPDNTTIGAVPIEYYFYIEIT